MNMVKLDKGSFITAVRACLNHAGFNAAETEAAISSWLFAQDSEKFSHGFIRLPWLLQQVENGDVVANGEYVVESHGFVTVIHGEKSLGYRAAQIAVQNCIEKARETGFSLATIDDCYPTGCLGEYVEKITNENMVGFAVSSSPPRVSAYNSVSRIFSTLGHSFGFPSSDIPYIYDSSVGSITHGHVELARQSADKLPVDTVFTKDGITTIHPNDVFDENNVFDGVINIAGGVDARKMSGFAGSLELFARLALATRKTQETPKGYSCFFAFNIQSIADVDNYKSLVDDLIVNIKTAKRIHPGKEVYFAGESSFQKRQINADLKHIAINQEIFNAVNKYL